MGRKPKGDETGKTVAIRLPLWVVEQIDATGKSRTDVLLPLILPHFKKEASNGEKTN
ncbi:hypothetical protein [Saccharibacillus qingshengii]|uniref:hypothetical protein n=1 Tax=Saccharibacillus qingshengii TaxID=1763540 RepID=UPI001553E033|nr:hypothetical protein [Saccharibacillus qingshengii]